MAYTTASIPDLEGTISVVTGANGGLGLETARALAGANSHVVMAVRNQAKAEEAKASIERSWPGASLEVVELDLGSLASVRGGASVILAAHDRIDLLVNNAGVMATPESRTADGFEMQLGVNHLGHWALTAHLMAPVLAADAARVVTVTSTVHHIGRPVDPKNPHLDGRYKPFRAYAQSKLANYHFGLGLQAEFAAAGVRAQSLIAHPGLTDTDLQSSSVDAGGGGWAAPLAHRLATLTGMRPPEGALPQLRAATDPRARGGEFYAPRFFNIGPAVRRPVLRPGRKKAIAQLWSVSERETGIPLTIA